ncbi:MAG: hypothetical protein KI790_18195, partial [Cyclobacteriaceae bacterium]|nr:hypothetical protein [Cyclobacteriaceae bacterium HetDA_MAG_MS6]
DEAGFTEDQAITIFPPIAVIAVVVTLLASAVSDYIQLKYLLYLKGFGACIGVAGLLLLGETPIAYYLMVLGNGIMAGLFSVLITVSWPRYFGRTHLGSISSQAIMMIVFGSALGPILFSGSLSRFGSYDMASSTCLVIYLGLTVASFWANNPQKRFRKA